MKQHFLKIMALATAISLFFGILAGTGSALATSNEDPFHL